MVDQNTMESVTGAGNVTDSVSGSTRQAPAAPTVLMGAQYVRGVTFRTLDSALIHTRPPVRPNTSMTLDVMARQVAENQPDFEVDVVMNCVGRADAPVEGGEAATLFETQITYSGLFSLRNATAETFEPLLLVEAPKMLFPAARNYLADLTREAGFLPVIIQHVDFLALWRSRSTTQKTG
ncbi:protein-export chaperone SecB [Acetobacter conturbans]|uniref:Preprotein translocase subunit SecB n=1 Tax=Acetobacter conturbans TaxID=1737472 RepID=A0ABX0K3C1_9PROT|nr:protein-export chaperone SecB [Acetobacter conturbans]NHN88818.1 preprotein translocase subunit SecB [Acetobacter conturbans]